MRTAWRVLTEVPGWPDAPVWMRMQRAMPVLIPCMALVLLLDWSLLFQKPEVRQQRLTLAPLISLEREVETLRLLGSDAQLVEYKDRAAQASALALASPASAGTLLQQWKVDATSHGWDATFVASEVEENEAAPGALFSFLPVRGKLLPRAANDDVFGSFVTLLEGLSAASQRIDLIRLVIRADEHRWQAVELNLQLIYPLKNEKAP